jgi:PAS domain S-box-containing protein
MKQPSPLTDFFDGIIRLAFAVCPGSAIYIRLTGTAEPEVFSCSADITPSLVENDIFSHYCKQHNCTLNIADVRKDPLFAAIPSTINQSAVIAYTGIPLQDPAGNLLGTMSVIKQQSVSCTAEQMQLLQILARQAATMLGRQKEIERLNSKVAELTNSNELAEQNSDQKYRSIIENSLTATMLTNPAEGTILDCNEAAAAMFGYTSKELKKQIRQNIIDQNDPNFALLAAKRDSEGKIQGELTGIRKNGERFPLLYSSAFFKDEAGEIRASMSGIDISLLKKTEQELLQEKETLNNVIEGTDAAVWEWNIQTGETVYNERWAEMLGYTLADLQPINKYTWTRLAHPADRKIAYRLMEACFNKETDYYDCEYRMKHKDGHWVWVLDRGKVISYTRDKKPLKMFGIHLDITARKNSVEVLQQKQALLETLMDTIDVGIAACDANGAITLFNKAARDLHGLPPDFAPSAGLADFFELCQPDCITPLAENEIPLAATLVGGDIHNVEVAIVSAKGQVRFLSVNGQQIKDASGTVTGAVVALHEITDRKKAEQLLAFSERRFREIFNSTFSFIGFLAPDGTLLEANETILRFSGVQPEMVINQKLWDCYWGQTSPEEQEKLKGKIGRAAKGEFMEYELEIESREGKKMTILFNLKPLFDDDGEVIAIVSEGRPIQEIVDARKSLQEKNAELEQFAFIASHDLKEPLRMVHSFMCLLRDNYREQLDAKANKYIDFAIDGSARMTEMVNQLLTYARLGSNEAEKELIDTNQLLKGILDLQQAVLEEKGAVVQASELPEIYGVRTPLVLLFQNLITNAIKYQVPGTQPVISISATETSRKYQFAIQDNGIGIAAKHHQEIFQLFKRLHTKQEFAGTGMGLATCKKIVEQHEGKIWVESEEGKGSTFYFTIKKVSIQSP